MSRPGRPTKHVHNWKLQFRPEKNLVPVPPVFSYLKPYSWGGFMVYRYYACIRGNKIKHTQKAFGLNPMFMPLSGVYGSGS